MRKPVRIGIGRPVGSGKTALLVALCREMSKEFSLAAVTNDIFTKEDAEFVVTSGAISSRPGDSVSRPADARTLPSARTCR